MLLSHICVHLGVIGFDKQSGFWLVHSTPRFPPTQSTGYDWPSSAKRYGQSFICISMSTSGNLNEIGNFVKAKTDSSKIQRYHTLIEQM